MSLRRTSDHLNARQVQAFLEDALPARERARVEEHLRACAVCAAEAEDWREVFEELNDLGRAPRLAPSGDFAARVMERVRPDLVRDEAIEAALNRLGHLAPSQGFAARVMSEVRVPGPRPLVARIRTGLARWSGRSRETGHVPVPTLQDYVDGLLPARRMARIRAHAGACAECRNQADRYRELTRALAELPHFGPAPDFGVRVMAAVRAAPAPAARRTGASARALAWIRARVPRSRRAWAAISGVAVTPMTTLGVVLYALASHPTLTPGAMASFAWWKISSLAGDAAQALLGAAVDSVPLFRAFTLLQALARTPWALVGGLAVASALTVGAAWILYRNLMATPRVDGTYAHVSI